MCVNYPSVSTLGYNEACTLRWRRNPIWSIAPWTPRPFRVDTEGHTADGFRGPQVCTLVGSRIDSSTTGPHRLLRPSIADARGSGTQRRYSYHDVLELKVIKQLLDAGISLHGRACRRMHAPGLGGDLAATNLVLVGTDSVLAHSDGKWLIC